MYIYLHTSRYASTHIHALYMFTYILHANTSNKYLLRNTYVHYTCLHTSADTYDLNMFIYFYAHVSIHVYILLCSYTYIYIYTCSYAHILIRDYIILCHMRPINVYLLFRSYTNTWLHGFQGHISIHVFRLLPPYTCTYLHTSMLIQLYMHTNFYAHMLMLA